jgi:hypothetical protein
MNITKRIHKYVYCEEQVSPLGIDETDRGVIKIDNKKFYEINEGNPFKGMMSQFQMRSQNQLEKTQRIVYFRRKHCHCYPCKQHDWDNCIHKDLPAAKWVQHDVANTAEELNKVTNDIIRFHSRKWKGVWNPNVLMVVALQLEGHENLVLAVLDAPLFQNQNKKW